MSNRTLLDVFHDFIHGYLFVNWLGKGKTIAIRVTDCDLARVPRLVNWPANDARAFIANLSCKIVYCILGHGKSQGNTNTLSC